MKRGLPKSTDDDAEATLDKQPPLKTENNYLNEFAVLRYCERNFNISIFGIIDFVVMKREIKHIKRVLIPINIILYNLNLIQVYYKGSIYLSVCNI